MKTVILHTIWLYCTMTVIIVAAVPVTDGNEEVFGSRGEEFKVGNVQLLHLNGLTELNDEPERKN